MPARIPEPWLGFLREVDRRLSAAAAVHCLGGFVLHVLWGLPRPTGDVDIVDVDPSTAAEEVLRIGGEESDLSRRYKLRFHRVTVAEYPEGYTSRLVDITPPEFVHLRILAFEVHDLVLAKLSRNSPRDREDVAYLAGKGVLDGGVLEERFASELRPYLLNQEREATTLRLWLDEYLPEPGG